MGMNILTGNVGDELAITIGTSIQNKTGFSGMHVSTKGFASKK
jgi:hypothetical protein